MHISHSRLAGWWRGSWATHSTACMRSPLLRNDVISSSSSPSPKILWRNLHSQGVSIWRRRRGRSDKVTGTKPSSHSLKWGLRNNYVLLPFLNLFFFQVGTSGWRRSAKEREGAFLIFLPAPVFRFALLLFSTPGDPPLPWPCTSSGRPRAQAETLSPSWSSMPG